MAYVSIADRDHEIEHHDPDTFITKYIWSQDHKVIAIQYGITAIFVGIVALVLSVLMRLQLGFPDEFSIINPESYYQFVTMHGMIMVIYLLTALFLGGFGNYLIPLMCGSRDMVFPYMNMLSYWVYLLSVIILLISFFVPGWSHRRGLDAVSATGDCGRHPGHRLGHHPDARVAGGVHRRVHDGRPELRDHRAAGALPGHDADAHAAFGLGHLHSHGTGTVGLPGTARQCNHDAARQDCSVPASSCRR